MPSYLPATHHSALEVDPEAFASRIEIRRLGESEGPGVQGAHHRPRALPECGAQIDLPFATVRALRAKEFEVAFETPGHLIDFNFAASRSLLQVQSSRRREISFAPGAVSFAAEGAALYRRSLESYEPHGVHDLIAVVINPKDYETLCGDLVDGQPLRFIDKLAPEPWPTMNRLQAALRACFLAPEYFNQLAVESIVKEIALRTAMRCSNLASAIPPVRIGGGVRILDTAVDFIEAHLQTYISLRDIAASAGVSIEFLTRAFRARTGTTPYDFLLRRRIEEAKRLLARSDLSLAEIAAVLQFGSQSHFTTVFKKYAHETPARFRRAMRGD